MKIQFAGAADTVTGSRYVVEEQGTRVLVDCGLFQGVKQLRERNWGALSFDPRSIASVVLTHAHIDHSGYLPRLVKAGFSGPVYCTRGTADLLRILLPDSGFLQEEEARRANKYGYAKHRPALPLYTRAEAEQCLERIEPVNFYTEFSPAAGLTSSFSRAGHIVGSGCLHLWGAERSIVFSGDVGRPVDLVMKPPDPLPACDTLVVESTYGDRRHPTEAIGDRVATIIQKTVNRGGTVVVPAFAVGRAQHLLHLVAELKAQGALPSGLPVYLDSPMAIDATALFCRHVEDHKLTQEQCRRLCEVARTTSTPDESKKIDRDGEPKVIISASGMATGGRVLHHLRRFLPEPQNTVMLVGYQAAGTRGRSLLEGSDELKLHGQYVTVRAQIKQVNALSAHADYAELIEWLRSSAIRPARVFVTHGEAPAADALRRRLRDTFGWEPIVPKPNATFDI